MRSPSPTLRAREDPAQLKEPSARDGGAALRQRRLMIVAALLAVTLLLYGPVVNLPFVNFDDPKHVVDNPHVRAGLTAESIRWAFTTFHMGHWHPLTWLSHMLDCQFFGLNASGHHWTSALLHAISVVLLFLLLNRATGALWRSAAVALLFALHPLNVENVAWIAERKSLLSALFSFLAIDAYASYAKSPSRRRYAWILIGFALALMAKSMAMTLPVLLLLLDYWPLDRLQASGEERLWRRWWPLVKEKLPLFAMSAGICAVSVLSMRSTGTVDTVLPLSWRLENAVVSYVAYLGKTLWPRDLAVYYPHPGPTLAAWKIAGAALLLALISALVMRLRRERYLVFGWLWYLLSLLPVIGILQLGGQAMADRYAYIPLIGIFVAVVWGVARLVSEVPRARAVAVAALAVACCALAWATREALGPWRSSLALFSEAARIAGHPDPTINGNLGQALDRLGRSDEAFEQFKLVRAINPADPQIRYNIGTYLLRRGQTHEAIAELEAAARFSQTTEVSVGAWNNLGTAHLLLREYPQAEKSYSAALALDANHLRAMMGRGQAYYEEGNFTAASGDFQRALRLERSPFVLLWFGKAREGEGKSGEAAAAYEEALKIDPQLAEAANRSAALRAAGNH